MAACLVCLICIISGIDSRHRHNFNKKWPAITDDEFLKRCPPGSDPEVALKVRRIISECLNVPYLQIHPQHRFVEDLQAG